MSAPPVKLGSRAMVLAAGLGKRMHPITLTCPKPLVTIAGKRLIDFAFDRLRAAGVEQAVINVHHLAEQIEDWAGAQTSPRIVISDERRELLDTGGGILKALPHLGAEPFFVLNSDSFWLEGSLPALERLRRMWRNDMMDCLLLLSPIVSSVGYAGAGDFTMDAEGRLSRKGRAGAPFVYAGCFLVSPRLFAEAPEGPFSMNLLWDKSLSRGRLFGIRHDGLWIHVGTPQSIAYAERVLTGDKP